MRTYDDVQRSLTLSISTLWSESINLRRTAVLVNNNLIASWYWGGSQSTNLDLISCEKKNFLAIFPVLLFPPLP